MEEQSNTIMIKTAELEEELRRIGLWQKDMPAWVHGYEEGHINSRTDFAQWLQYVFVPNHLLKNKTIPSTEKNLIVPQAIKFFGNDVNKGKLLQILIEIDSLL